MGMAEMEAKQEGPTGLDVVDSIVSMINIGAAGYDAAAPFLGPIEELSAATPFIGSAADLWGLGNGVADVVGALSEGGEGMHDDDFYDGAGSIVNNGVSLAGTGLALGLTAAAGGAGGFVGSIFGPLGTAIGGAGGAAAAATMVEGANTVVGAGMAGLDALGLGARIMGGRDAAFGADSITGSLIRGTMGDESLGWGVGSSVSSALGGGVGADIAGGVVGTATNLMAAPVNIADTMIGGLVNFGADVMDSDETESTAWQDFKTSINPFAGMY